MTRPDPFLWHKARPRFVVAQKHGQTLLDEISSWMASKPFRAEFELHDDVMGFSCIFQKFDPEPQVDEWAVRYGGVAHEYRAVLDNAIEELARAEDVGKNYRRHFPTATTKAQWEKEARNLAGLPERVIGVLRAMQPFVHHRGTRDAADHVLAVLSWTDNGDKHDDLLALDFIEESFEASGSFVLDDPSVRIADVAKSVKKLNFEPGSELLRVRVEPYTIKSMDRVDVWLRPAIAARDHAGLLTPLVDAMTEFMEFTLQSVFLLSAVYEDPGVDTSAFAGATDALQGSSFGRAAVDQIHGTGVWNRDHRHSGNYLGHDLEGRVKATLGRLERLGKLPPVLQ